MPYWKLYYHFIWGTKNRLPLIDAGFEPKLHQAIAAKGNDLDGFVRAIGGIEDHIIWQFLFCLRLHLPNLLAMSKGIVHITLFTSSSLISSFTGRMSTVSCLLVRGTYLQS